MAGKQGEQGVAMWILIAIVVVVAGAVWYAAIIGLFLGWLLIWALGYLAVACMLPFNGTEVRRSRIVAELGGTPIERTRRFWLGALTFGIWTRRHPAPVSPRPLSRPRPGRLARRGGGSWRSFSGPS